MSIWMSGLWPKPSVLGCEIRTEVGWSFELEGDEAAIAKQVARPMPRAFLEVGITFQPI